MGRDQDDLRRPAFVADSDLQICLRRLARLSILTGLKNFDVPAVLQHRISNVVVDEDREVAISLPIVFALFTGKIPECNLHAFHQYCIIFTSHFGPP
jgi:hypothetical protein